MDSTPVPKTNGEGFHGPPDSDVKGQPSPPDHTENTDSGYTTGDNLKPEKPAEVQDILRGKNGVCTASLGDEEIVKLAKQGVIQPHALESELGDPKRAVRVRRKLVEEQRAKFCSTLDRVPCIDGLPWENFDYQKVAGRCAENIIGYMTVPVGVVGPLKVDDTDTFVPMSTTEGALIAGTSRGCKALTLAGGVKTELLGDGMTRAPCVRFSKIRRAAEAKHLLASDAMQDKMRYVFGTTTSHGSLLDVVPRMVGVYLHLRFRACSGEAMGMNMLSKGADAVLHFLRKSVFPDMEVVALSGNTCTDKKPSAINWIEGRGKSVVAEAIVPAEVITTILKTTVERLVKLNISKNLVGSALAATSTGGFNAHAANIVAAVYLATGQDVSQVVTSSNCMTLMESTTEGSLHATVTMPSIEVGTMGGGTHLHAQASMLRLSGCNSTAEHSSGSVRLASLVAATVLAGELNLCSALASEELVKSHMALNRPAQPQDMECT